MTQKSPVVFGQAFDLPFSDVVSPVRAAEDTASEENSESEVLALATVLAQVSRASRGPVAVLNRFCPLGVPKDRPGILHTAFFSKRPVSRQYTVSDEYKVSGYVSYAYLYSGSVVVGIMFSTDNSKTLVRDCKMVVRCHEHPQNFVPNFNLEKMGLLMFVADDSSTLIIPNDIESSLLVRTE